PGTFTVGDGGIEGGSHGAEIALADIRIDWRARKLPIGKRNAGRRRSGHHVAQIFRSNLMTEAARATMNSHHDIVRGEAVDLGCACVKNLGNRLHLKIMVAGPYRTHLAALPLARAFRDALGHGACHRAVLFDPIEVGSIAPAAIDGPACSTRKHRVHLDSVEGNSARAADTC